MIKNTLYCSSMPISDLVGLYACSPDPGEKGGLAI